ncbi:MAG: cupin [Geminicoccaceae bacterium]
MFMVTTRNAALVLTCLGVVGITTGSYAATCPEDQILSEPRELEQAPDIGVDRPILGTVDLTGWREMGNFMLRLRKLTIAPDGVVPTHNHADRPSIVHIVEGEIVEHNAYCAVPIVHRAGDTAPEAGEGHIHWWENVSGEPVVIFSTDVVPFQAMDVGDM